MGVKGRPAKAPHIYEVLWLPPPVSWINFTIDGTTRVPLVWWDFLVVLYLSLLLARFLGICVFLGLIALHFSPKCTFMSLIFLEAVMQLFTVWLILM